MKVISLENDAKRKKFPMFDGLFLRGQLATTSASAIASSPIPTALSFGGSSFVRSNTLGKAACNAALPNANWCARDYANTFAILCKQIQRHER